MSSLLSWKQVTNQKPSSQHRNIAPASTYLGSSDDVGKREQSVVLIQDGDVCSCDVAPAGLQTVQKEKKKGEASTSEWTTSQIWEAAQKVVADAVAIPYDVMKNLSRSIRLRSQVYASFPPDQGYAYFLELLQVYGNTWSSKRALPYLQYTTSPPVARTHQLLLGGQPPAVRSCLVPAPVVENEAAILCTEQEQFRVLCFFHDMDELMGQVKRAWQQFKTGAISLQTATVVTNTCVRRVEALTAELQLEFDYLHDLDHMCALLSFGPVLEVLWKRSRIQLEIARKLRVSVADAHAVIARVVMHFMAKGTEYLLGTLGIIQPTTRQLIKPGFLGPDCNESEALATTSAQLYQMFMGDVMSPMLTHARDTRVLTIEHQADTLMWPHLVKQFQATKTTPLVFAAQSLFFSILYTQGSADCAVVVATGRRTRSWSRSRRVVPTSATICTCRRRRRSTLTGCTRVARQYAAAPMQRIPCVQRPRT
ncbi:Aste57867_823 [Aphanomyces stellatus]|uniref:Aste57867_823 protein n=1 Tax=Aphanomyces stellatus TaxID=120398 RepID=A0A485K7P9_9STRA|nr:hypothetical protein As57867_000822 [Aphanomyces stellatus]VFT78047.1 Aste57867_823 [Aphanomyces stellatus]